MHQNNLTLATRRHKWLIWLAALLFMTALSACGGQAEQVAMSEQAPPRRGGIDILAEVQAITSETLGIPEADVVEEADFRQDLNADDDGMARLAEAFEEAFTIQLTDDEVADLTTVRSAVDLIESKK